MTPNESPFRTEIKAAGLQRRAAELRNKAESLENEAIRLLSPDQCREAAESISKRKGNVAVFLGAGASKTFGWPLTNELLPLILDGVIEEDLFEDERINSEHKNASDRELLTDALVALCPGLKLTRHFLRKNNQRLPLVTSLLSMLDYSVNSGQAVVSGLSNDEIKDARMLLERAIYETIEHEAVAAGPKYWPQRDPNELTTQLVTWMDQVRAQPSLGVITSNYDVAIEKAWGFNRDDMEEVDDLSLSFGLRF